MQTNENSTPDSSSLSAKNSESLDELPPSAQAKMRAELRKRERIIQQGRKAWHVEATALMEIRDLRLYRAEGFTDFGCYCKQRLETGKSTVNRQIAIGEVYKAVASTEAKCLPESERQMRPLLIMRKELEKSEVWSKNVALVWAKVVHDAEVTKQRITEKSVIIARHQLGFDPEVKKKTPEADLEKRWMHLEAVLENEREFWPDDQRRELCVRIVGLVTGWETGTGQSVVQRAGPASTIHGNQEDAQAQASMRAATKQGKGQQTNHHRFAAWEHLNWHLSNRHLAEIWSLRRFTVRQMRFRKNHGPARSIHADGYDKELQQEKVKAKELIR